MVLRTWGDVVVESLMQSWAAVGNFIPLFIGAVVVFLIGWVVAVALGSLVEQIVKAIRIDAMLQKLELEKALERGGVRLNSGVFLGALVRWFVIIVFLLAAANILGLSQVSEFLTQVLYYIPNVVVAALILLIALKVAEVVERSTRASAEAAGMRGAIVGVMARWAIWVFAVVAALLQLGVATVLIETLLTGLVAMLAIAFGLAFGLGGKDAASSFIDKVKREISGRA
ncbi:MAG: hypothetical protein A3A44_02105 [Candidatus Sungbacteria bacterium RIFCSPLOWO2_01_FULL_60_25]|uniref:Small-conductance mechanosensitive ion channel n=1 Tax=Candidatus Sungbacteria bacterium RIFCSPLOWO2_01_FULL_60_25 TaxID=1802281 RepID=A0A1G2LAJ1_9BACT|nr:MAG: hypothetical protein A3A44_02105 [Candidatus Sungbacteria bacterium RIFCSPLOWO2_01_FULL_60_25]